MEEGRRLENMSWRLWQRETFCCTSKPQFPDTPTSLTPRPRSRSKRELPELSGSVDSAASEDYERIPEHRSASPPVHIKGLSSTKTSVESFSSSKGKGKPISSRFLEKMILSIKETMITPKAGMTGLPASITEAVPSVPTFQLCSPPKSHASHKASDSDQTVSPQNRNVQRASQSSTSTAPLSSPESNTASSHLFGSDTSADMITSHSIVRGFTPNTVSSSQRLPATALAPTSSPVPIKSSLRYRMDNNAKSGNFMLGGSSGDESSLDDHGSLKPRQSSLTAAIKRETGDKKTTFKEEVEPRTIANQVREEDSAAIETDDEENEDEDDEDDDDDDDDNDEEESEEEEGDVCESAIEEDDSDWEDSVSDSGAASPNDKKLFQRVDSKANLASRRSLLTTMMHQSDRAAALAGEASKTTSTRRRSGTTSGNESSAVGSPEDDDSALEMEGNDITRSKPIIMTTSYTHPPALSPRSTRKGMLSNELTESLRKHILWERQMKNTTANAHLQRRHTAHDVANLQQYPNRQGSQATSKTNSWNELGGNDFHAAGW